MKKYLFAVLMNYISPFWSVEQHPLRGIFLEQNLCTCVQSPQKILVARSFFRKGVGYGSPTLLKIKIGKYGPPMQNIRISSCKSPIFSQCVLYFHVFCDLVVHNRSQSSCLAYELDDCLYFILFILYFLFYFIFTKYRYFKILSIKFTHI